jgi:outer membrane protein TolC
MKKSTIIISFLLWLTKSLHAQQEFNDLDSFLTYASSKSTTLSSGDIKYDQAKKAKLAAIFGIPDPSGNISFTYTNNTTLGVFIINNEQVTQGVQYNSNFNQSSEIKLFNLQGWQNLTSAKANMGIVSTDNQLTRKSLFENIASTYFNIVQLQEQLKATHQNVLANDTLLIIAENKLKQGQIKQQDVNDTKVSYLNTKENAKQIEFQIHQQYLALKILADIPDINHIISIEPTSVMPEVAYNNLNMNNALSKERLALSNYRKNRLAQTPTISLFYSDTEQQYNQNSRLFDDRVSWIPSTYLGFKINLPMPGANTVSSIFESRYNYKLAKKSTEHAKIKADLDRKQLSTEYTKVWSQFVTNEDIFELKKDSYKKNLNLFKQGLLATEQTLNSFNAMINSHYNLITSAISVLLANAKIDINNTIK